LPGYLLLLSHGNYIWFSKLFVEVSWSDSVRILSNWIIDKMNHFLTNVKNQRFPWCGKFETKHEIDQYFSNPDGIQCLLCGRFFQNLSLHLWHFHGISHEKYRGRYGLPWRKGLVSRNVSKGFSSRLTKRIKNGSFKPKPDNKAAVDKIRAGGRRKDQPYTSKIKSEKAKGLCKKNIRHTRKDYNKVLSVMLKHKIALREACMDENLPALSLVLGYAESNPDFRKKLLDTYYSLPYDVQARADMFSPQFYKDLKRLKAKGLANTKIGKKLGVSHKTVRTRLERISIQKP
jgi:predicted transcriptional regulator